MSQAFTNKQLNSIREIERLAWNEAIKAAAKIIQADGRPFYQESIDSILSLYRGNI